MVGGGIRASNTLALSPILFLRSNLAFFHFSKVFLADCYLLIILISRLQNYAPILDLAFSPSETSAKILRKCKLD